MERPQTIIQIGKPINKFRIYIRQTQEGDKKDTHSSSFMIYDFNGKITIEKLKKELSSIAKKM